MRARIDAAHTEWRGLAAKHVQAARQLLRKGLVGRLTFTPHVDGVVRFTGDGTLAQVMGRLRTRQFKGWWS